MRFKRLDGNNEDSFVYVQKLAKDTVSVGPFPSQAGCELLLTSLAGKRIEDGTGRLIDRYWIDEQLIKSWKSNCVEQHGETCSEILLPHLARPRLAWLIDVAENRIVDASEEYSYVALSYLWGGKDMLKLTKQNLMTLRQPKALSGANLPQTIADAIKIVRLLGERYLWVDALCIIQDDDETRDYLITHMTSVYANAILTIVAADGADADFGIRGLKGISSPRDNPCVLELGEGTVLNSPGGSGIGESMWNDRGWTFQEYLFSRRRLIFVGQSVRWECSTSCYCEEYTEANILPTEESCSQYESDNTPIRRAFRHLPPKFPTMIGYDTLVSGYNGRQLTYSEDAVAAFSGVINALEPYYHGGFLWGLPVMFLDISLLWRARLHQNSEPGTSRFHRRSDPRLPGSRFLHAPTWSWAGWQGQVESASTWRNEDWVMFSFDEWFYHADPIKRVIPLVKWSICEAKDAPPVDVLLQNEWYRWKSLYLTSKTREEHLPSGWTRTTIDYPEDGIYPLDASSASFHGRLPRLDRHRDKYPPSCYFTHESLDSIKFCHPMPLRSEVSHEDAVRRSSGRYLCCKTERATFYIERPEDVWSLETSKLSVWDRQIRASRMQRQESDSSDGFLVVDDPSYISDGFGSHSAASIAVELVVISMMYRARSGKRWEEPMGEENPQYYNVLWAERIDGISYRKGVGEVHRSAWDKQAKEKIELILG
ncbi:hypothetical protein JX266_006821 [Neoarthrinium moseri]|nr:hypothetical protein JX266_006821 [Neoarthrinium moseri]